MSSRRTGRPARPARPSQTCNVCKLRHQKCDSSRPTCQYCLLRDLECFYSKTPAHQVTRSSVRKRGEKPQQGFKESANDDLSCLKAVQRPGSSSSREVDLETPLRPGTGQRSPSRPTTEEGFRAADYASYSPVSPFKASLQYFVAVLGRTLLDDNEAESALSLAVSSEYTDDADTKDLWRGTATQAIYSFDRYNLPSKAQLQSFLDSFLDGPNKIIFVCEPSESQNQLDDLYYRSKDISHASLSLILLQLAIGAQTLGGIPHQTCSTLYERGRKFMEAGIERTQANWLWVVQAYILDCIYSMNVKPKMCWVVLGSAIRIAQTYHIDDSHHKGSWFSQAEHCKWRQVWLGMVFLDAWFSAALGRLPQINKNTTRDLFLQNIYMEVGMPAHLVQTSLARISVIVGGILQDIYAVNSASIHTYERYTHELEIWLSALPQPLRPHGDYTSGDVQPEKSRGDRIAMVAQFGTDVFGVDVAPYQALAVRFYSYGKGTKILGNTTEYPIVCSDLALYNVCYSVDTATQIGHLSSLMMSQGLLAKKSWPVIYFNFHAALVLFTSLSQKISVLRYNPVGAQLQARRQMEHDGLNACMNIMAFCATEDQLASHYLSIANVFQNVLSTANVKLQPESTPETFPTATDTEATDPSLHYYDCSASNWGPPPALTNTSTPQASISTSMSYHDTDQALVQINSFDPMQDLSVDPKCLYLNTSNSLHPPIGNNMWAPSSCELDFIFHASQYAPPLVGYIPAGDCGPQPPSRH